MGLTHECDDGRRFTARRAQRKGRRTDTDGSKLTKNEGTIIYATMGCRHPFRRSPLRFFSADPCDLLRFQIFVVMLDPRNTESEATRRRIRLENLPYDLITEGTREKNGRGFWNSY